MKSKTVLVTSLAAVTFGLVSLVDTAGALPFSAKTVQADTQTLTTAAKYYILVPKDSEVFKNWRGTANRPIIWATKTTPELSYFQESARNYIANENKSGANYIEWKGTVEEFKEAIKNLTDKKLTPNPAPIPQSDKKPTPDPTPNPQSTVPSGWSGSSYYQNGTKVTSKWIFDKNYNSYFYLDASGNYVQNAWEGDYYLKSGGYMAKKEWIYDKNYGAYYYLTPDGYYARNTWVGNYYLKSNGKMAKSEWIYDKNYSSYYYLTSEGSYARNTWVGDYYLKSNGKMAVSERTPDGYQVDGSGKWISSEGTHTASSSQATSLGISLYNVNDAMTYIDIALPSTPSSSYQVAYDFALVDANTGSVSTQTQFTVTYNPSLRVFQTRHFFSATPDGSYRFVIKGKGQDGKVYDGQSVVFRVKNHRFVG
ncbi:choline binding domain Cbp6 [Streptococcus pneumoniae]|uniref:N-acetylmuramoyl-L-alanine amidase family protein n=1 Tax=Streptococcus pneumoniae TaxID=1313 RepID=UPI0005DEBBAE|nr:N-acetylmuramoyl-L-alanine amidase family protein [Streptococcus pneumoniae]SBV76960.1 endo-beta-N-acetylglucosaminidase [Streptococcus pneumoniae]SND01304.1 choline binding domain Cbp6 [Streptococcus pneumoniae]HEV5506591.1 N-acetylmuramoyl-L-alanine amidase family protein [Streptococcus pneumoniae]